MVFATIALLGALSAAPPAGPMAVQTPPAERVLRRVVFDRPDAAPGRATVYLPPGYHTEPDRTYPLLILLHGLGSRGDSYIDAGQVHALLDQKIREGSLEPVIAVMPDGGSGYWVDWPTRMPEHTFGTLVEPDVRTWAERTYRTDGRRAIGGLSMGGFGALSIALRHPGVYSAAISLSGALFEQPPVERPVYLAAFGYPGLHQGRFAFYNPLDLVRMGRAEGLSIWLDCGIADAPRFTQGLSAVSWALRKAGIEHVASVRPGGHEWSVWRRGLSEALPWLQSRWPEKRP